MPKLLIPSIRSVERSKFWIKLYSPLDEHLFKSRRSKDSISRCRAIPEEDGAIAILNLKLLEIRDKIIKLIDKPLGEDA
jgi:hypothetical protein